MIKGRTKSRKRKRANSSKNGGNRATKRKSAKASARKNSPLKPNLKKVILEKANARKVLKQETGTDFLGSTDWLTPTVRGFNTVERLAEAILDANKKTKGSGNVEVYSYNLHVRYRDPKSGERKVARNKDIGASLTLKKWVTKRTKGKRRQIVESFRETVRTRLYEILSQIFDVMSPGKSPGREISAKQAKKELREFKEGRDVKFKLEIFRISVKPAKAKKRAKARK